MSLRNKKYAIIWKLWIERKARIECIRAFELDSQPYHLTYPIIGLQLPIWFGLIFSDLETDTTFWLSYGTTKVNGTQDESSGDSSVKSWLMKFNWIQSLPSHLQTTLNIAMLYVANYLNFEMLVNQFILH